MSESMLNKLDKMSQEQHKLSSSVRAMEIAFADVTTVKQEIGNAMQSLEAMQGQNQKLVTDVNARFEGIFQYSQDMLRRQMALEQSLTSLAKTITALSEELSSRLPNGDDFGTAVVARIRKMDERAEQARVQHLLQLKVIEEAQESGGESLVVVSQEYIPAQGAAEVVGDYIVLEMPSDGLSKEIKDMFKGKRVGDVVSDQQRDASGNAVGEIRSTVKQIFNLSKLAESQGEASQESKAE